ncbi:hypothetical protein FF098_015320 [Parvularcula flava]|uniref:Uncharacterized protein n=1 Tax=Aquisalinus luteolus TaxID=1566827 RepID=A0A8J3A9E5_9PROT|nr:hypothetical protein [Aquisalinus luteolus]NHK29287.1 hypothetical protein [Aquisalinus luteolus]GGI01236.1 hypothetical protein GCM10011355_31400 [Aquisalinus luteolus]
MKRILPFILLALAACGGGEEPSSDQLPDPAADPAAGGIRPADGVYPFQGLWANDFTDCSLAPGTSDAAPLQIEGRTITGLENTCYMFELSAIDDQMSRYEAGLRCTGEGDPYEEVVEIEVNGDTMTKISPQGTVTWTRCPVDDAGQ